MSGAPSVKVLRLRKRLAYCVGALAAVLAVLTSVYIGLSSYRDDLYTRKTRLKADVNTINTQIQTLEKKYQSAKQNLNLFEQLTKGAEQSNLSLDRETASEILNRLKARYHLASLSMKISPVSELKGGAFERPTTRVVYTSIALRFAGLTDEYLLSFVDAVASEFSGYVRVSTLTLRRDKEADEEALIAVSRGEIPPLVAGEMEIYWLGLQERQEGEKKGG